MRKGQAAMEFLMTYGWAILIVLAAIGALAYCGILSPDRFLPERINHTSMCEVEITTSYARQLCKEQGFDSGYFSSVICENGIQCYKEIRTVGHILTESKCIKIGLY